MKDSDKINLFSIKRMIIIAIIIGLLIDSCRFVHWYIYHDPCVEKCEGEEWENASETEIELCYEECYYDVQ